MTGINETTRRRTGPVKISLVVALLAVAVFLSVVAARTDVIAIVDTGDGGPVAMATLALLDSGGATPVPSGKGDNYAVAINTEDGTSLAETAFLITYAANGVVNQENAAVAYASCETCQAFAFAVEVVLVPADKADNITPTNIAAAVNEECTTCTTGAFATQIVLGVDGPVGFTEEGNEALEEIQEDLEELAEDAEDGGLTLAEIQARYDEIIARLKDVLANEIVPIGNSDQHKQEERESTTLEDTTAEDTEGPETEDTDAEETTGPTDESTTPEKTAAEQTAPESATPETTATPEATTPGDTPANETTAAPTAAPAPEESVPSGTGTAAPGEPTTAP